MRRRYIPWILLALSLLLTAVLALTMSNSTREREAMRLDNAVETTRNRIEARLETHIALLRGGAGLFAASEDDVTLDEFRRYTSQVEVRRQYPGVQGIGFSERVARVAEDSLIQAIRRQGMEDFHLWPQVLDTFLHAIVYLEPLDERNAAALGYNMFSEETRREAMTRARDSGEPALSGKVTLVQEIDERKQAGFLIYLPVYHGGGVPPDVADRRRRLHGFVYAPFRADDLFEGALGGGEQPRVAFRIFDGSDASEESLLYDSRTTGITPRAGGTYSISDTLSVAERQWTLLFAPTDVFSAPEPRLTFLRVLFLGLILSFLLFGLIRAQLRAAESAARSEQRLKAVLEALPVGACVADASGRVTFANSAHRDVWATSDARQSIRDPRFKYRDVNTGETVPDGRMALARALDGEVVHGETFCIDAFDGTPKTILVSALPIHGKRGNVELAVGAEVDISPQMRAKEAEARALREHALREAAESREEELRRHAIELERSNRELQDFAYVASHDLQEPLRKIITFTELIMDEFGENLGGEGRSYLGRAQDAAVRMSRLIKDLLAFSRVATRAEPFRKVDLNGILQDALSDLEVPVEQTGAQVNVQALPVLEADPSQMRQLFQNIIGNSLKFHRAGRAPRIDVSSEPVPLRDDGTRAARAWKIEFADNGIGFDEKYLDRIFSPFQRLHGRSAYEGTGMGLAICRRIVERHNGAIEASSTEGEGSVFRVVIPERQPEQT